MGVELAGVSWDAASLWATGALGAPQLLAPWLQGPKVLSLCAARRHLTRHALPVVNNLTAPAPD